MHPSELTSNPFALMMNPEAVVAAMNRSDRLQHLKSHVCRPLDKPVPLKPWPGLTSIDRNVDTSDSDDAN